jgi:hypothetical protein
MVGRFLPKGRPHALEVSHDFGVFGNRGGEARLTSHAGPEFPKHDQAHAMLNGARQSVGSTQSHIWDMTTIRSFLGHLRRKYTFYT